MGSSGKDYDKDKWTRTLGKLAGVHFEEWISDIPEEYSQLKIGIGKFFHGEDWAYIFIMAVEYLEANNISPNQCIPFKRRLQRIAPLQFNKKMVAMNDTIAGLSDIIRLAKEKEPDKRNKRKSQG